MTLLEKHPDILGDLGYLSIHPGWDDLIDQLCSDLWMAVSTSSHSNQCEVKAVQIKEKFGGLRFYIETKNLTEWQYNQVCRLIKEAEHKSFKICEICGEPGGSDHTSKYWLKTRCKKHQTNNEIDRDPKTGERIFKSEQ